MDAKNIYDMYAENERLKKLIDKYAKELRQAIKDKNAWKQLTQTKDQRIKVLERAFHLALASYGIRIGQYDMTAYGNDLLSQAKKELEND